MVSSSDKKILDKHIDQTVKETEDYEDAVQYVDDIFYDFESEIKETVTEDEQKEYKQYSIDQLKLKAKE